MVKVAEQYVADKIKPENLKTHIAQERVQMLAVNPGTCVELLDGCSNSLSMDCNAAKPSDAIRLALSIVDSTSRRNGGLEFVLEPTRLQNEERETAYTIKRCTTKSNESCMLTDGQHNADDSRRHIEYICVSCALFCFPNVDA